MTKKSILFLNFIFLGASAWADANKAHIIIEETGRGESEQTYGVVRSYSKDPHDDAGNLALLDGYRKAKKLCEERYEGVVVGQPWATSDFSRGSYEGDYGAWGSTTYIAKVLVSVVCYAHKDNLGLKWYRSNYSVPKVEGTQFDPESISRKISQNSKKE